MDGVGSVQTNAWSRTTRSYQTQALVGQNTFHCWLSFASFGGTITIQPSIAALLTLTTQQCRQCQTHEEIATLYPQASQVLTLASVILDHGLTTYLIVTNAIRLLLLGPSLSRSTSRHCTPAGILFIGIQQISVCWTRQHASTTWTVSIWVHVRKDVD